MSDNVLESPTKKKKKIKMESRLCLKFRFTAAWPFPLLSVKTAE